MSFFKKSSIRFDGKREVELRIKNQTDNVISRRFKILIGFVIIIGVFLLGRLFITQITQKDYYTTKLAQYNTNIYTSDTYRGNIYDRNYKRLVYNKNISCATYYAVKDISDQEINAIVEFLIDHINIDVTNVKVREKKDYLIMKLTKEKRINELLSDEQRTNDSDTNYKRQLEAIDEDMLARELSDYDIKYYMLSYKISSCYSGSVVLLEGLSIKEASIIGENTDILRGIKVTSDWSREYTYNSSFKQVLGKVTTKKEGLPAEMKELLLSKDYNNDSRVGTSGLELQYEDILSGSSATYSISYDAQGNPIVKSISNGTKGQNIRLTIDWDLQEALSNAIENELKANDYADRNNNHIFMTLMDPNNGEILAMVGKQRNPDTGEIIDYAAGNYLSAYAIGSTFKGATIYTGFKEGIIDENTIFNDTAAGIKIKGTVAKKSWNKNGLGLLDAVEALSLSSNVYMFYVAIGLGEATYQYDQPLYINEKAFDTLRKDAGELGLGVKTGLDVPNEGLGVRGKNRTSGLLLDASIGQYDTYTPIQMAQYVSTIANGGKRIKPHLFLESFTEDESGNKIALIQHQIEILDDVSSYKTAFETVRAGFRKGCVTGLATSVKGSYEPAGKTGTAEVYITGESDYFTNRAFIGYAPYDDPQITVTCMSEAQGLNSSSSCNTLSKYAFEKYFEKYQIKNKENQ